MHNKYNKSCFPTGTSIPMGCMGICFPLLEEKELALPKVGKRITWKISLIKHIKSGNLGGKVQFSTSKNDKQTRPNKLI